MAMPKATCFTITDFQHHAIALQATNFPGMRVDEKG
jgi:hypothetical protein